MEQVVYHEDFKAFVEDILEKPTALGDWLVKRAARQEMFGCSMKDFRCAVSNALHSHFTMEDVPAQAERISTSTIFGVEEAFLKSRGESPEIMVGQLVLATPTAYLSEKSIRRTQFLHTKAAIMKIAEDLVRTEIVSEVLYLAFAIMEDRENRGMSLPM